MLNCRFSPSNVFVTEYYLWGSINMLKDFPSSDYSILVDKDTQTALSPQRLVFFSSMFCYKHQIFFRNSYQANRERCWTDSSVTRYFTDKFCRSYHSPNNN